VGRPRARSQICLNTAGLATEVATSQAKVLAWSDRPIHPQGQRDVDALRARCRHTIGSSDGYWFAPEVGPIACPEAQLSRAINRPLSDPRRPTAENPRVQGVGNREHARHPICSCTDQARQPKRVPNDGPCVA